MSTTFYSTVYNGLLHHHHEGVKIYFKIFTKYVFELLATVCRTSLLR